MAFASSTMVRYLKSGDGDKSDPKLQSSSMDEMFLVLVKLKRASGNQDLGERFGITDGHVSRIFITWIMYSI